MLGGILRALVSNAFAQACSLLLGLVLVPVYLTHWSITVYGEWLALSSAAAYLSTLDIGMQMAAVNRLTQAYAKEDLAEYRRIQNTALVFYISIAAAGAICVLACALLLPLPELMGIRDISESEARFCLFLLGFQVLISIPLGLIGATYRCTGRIATGQWIANGKQILTGFVTLFALISGKGPAVVALLQLTIMAFVIVGVTIDVANRFPSVRPGVRLASWKAFRELVPPSFMFSFIMAGNALSLQGPPLLIAPLLGGAAVARFVTCRSLVSYGKQLTSIFTNSVWTDLTRLEATGRIDRLRTFQRLFVGVTCAVSIGFNMFVAFEGSKLVQIWSAGKIVGSSWLLIALAVAALLQTNWQAVSLVCISSNRHSRLSISTLVSSVLGIALMTAGIPHFGVVAVPVAMIVSEGLVCYHFAIADACHVMNLSYPRFAFQLWSSTLLATGLSWGAAVLLTQHFAAGKPVQIFLVGICSQSIALVVMALAFLRPSDRRFAIERLTRAAGLRPVPQAA